MIAKEEINMGNPMVAGILYVIIGALFVLFPKDALFWVMVLAGVFLVIVGILGLVELKGFAIIPAIEIILGLLLIAAPFLLVDIMLFLIGAVLIVLAICAFINLKECETKKEKVYGFVGAVLLILLGILFFILPAETVTFVAGVIFIIVGAAYVLRGLRI